MKRSRSSDLVAMTTHAMSVAAQKVKEQRINKTERGDEEEEKTETTVELQERLLQEYLARKKQAQVLSALSQCCIRGDVDAMTRIHTEHPNLDLDLMVPSLLVAARHGHVDIVRHLLLSRFLAAKSPAENDPVMSAVAREAAKAGSVPVLRLVFETNTDVQCVLRLKIVFMAALQGGHVSTIAWYLDMFDRETYVTMGMHGFDPMLVIQAMWPELSGFGHLDALQYLLQQWQLRRPELVLLLPWAESLQYACEKNQVTTASWLADRIHDWHLKVPQLYDIFWNVCKFGHADMVRWFYRRYCYDIDLGRNNHEIFRSLCKASENHFRTYPVIQWLVDTFPTVYEVTWAGGGAVYSTPEKGTYCAIQSYRTNENMSFDTMDSVAAIGSEPLTTCSLCCDSLTQVETNACKHRFCYACICQWYNAAIRKQETCSCPFCRVPVRHIRFLVTDVTESPPCPCAFCLYKKKLQDAAAAEAEGANRESLRSSSSACSSSSSSASFKTKSVNDHLGRNNKS